MLGPDARQHLFEVLGSDVVERVVSHDLADLDAVVGDAADLLHVDMDPIADMAAFAAMLGGASGALR